MMQKKIGLVVLFLSVMGSFAAISCQAQQEGGVGREVRPPAVAGAFYPADPAVLREQVAGYLANVQSLNLPDHQIISILVPHAGYAYSGQIAALAYKQIENKKVDTVILMGPSHRVGFPTISVYPQGSYQTPLGLVKVDAEVAQKLIAADPRIDYYPPAHQWEHALEVQLPFLQVLFPKVKIVPVVMGGQTRENVELMIKILTDLLRENKRLMLITTCDYSHYYPYNKAVQLDRVAMAGIEQMDYRKFLSLVEEKKCEMDAYGPVAITMEVAKRLGANKAHILKYANSGDVTGDKSRVVGYAAVLFMKDGILCSPVDVLKKSNKNYK